MSSLNVPENGDGPQAKGGFWHRVGERIVEVYVNLPRGWRKPLWRFWHRMIINWDSDYQALKFMNYGYSPLEGQGLELMPEDEQERFGAQLYHTAATHTDVADSDMLEVSSGRGGGASYIARYLKPQTYVGLDLSDDNVKYCTNVYGSIPGLSFVRGDAENLPFDDGSFDFVLNVEASRAYGDVGRFFDEVKRVLRPTGRFLLTDMRWADDVAPVREMLLERGFHFESEVDISPNVVEALNRDNDRKTELMHQRVPKFFVGAFSEFAGMKGSERYDSFASGRMVYFSWMLSVTK